MPQVKWPTNANATLCAYGLTFHLSATYLLRLYQALKLTIGAEKPYYSKDGADGVATTVTSKVDVATARGREKTCEREKTVTEF